MQCSCNGYLATFMPWSASLNRFSLVQDVGPIVHTILVLRKGVMPFDISGLHNKEQQVSLAHTYASRHLPYACTALRTSQAARNTVSASKSVCVLGVHTV